MLILLATCISAVAAQRCPYLIYGSHRFMQKSDSVRIHRIHSNESAMVFDVEVLYNVTLPAWQTRLTRTDFRTGEHVLFDVQIRMCKLHHGISKIPFIRAGYSFLMKHTNFTAVCPLPASLYFIRVVQFPYEVFPWQLFYIKGSTMTVEFIFHDLQKPKHLTYLADYAVNVIVKDNC